MLTTIACGTTIFSGTHVFAAPGTDLSLQFLAWRQFGFAELAHGNLPLWNPYIYGGAPFFAGFQSALLYPPNWLHLILPMAPAINLQIALHVFAAGSFTYLWCRRRASIPASILAGVMFMFGGPFFLHIYSGHLPHIGAIVWIPLILMTIDGVVEALQIKWCLLGATAITMQILAGHPQYVYYTAIIAMVYGIVSIALHRPPGTWRVIAGCIGMYAGAALLSAIQLFPGIALAGETVRSGGLSYGMAGTFSIPPENFLTLIAPNLLGALPPNDAIADATRYYFGRTYLWETSLFMSVTGAVLAIYGAIAMQDKRLRWLLVIGLLTCIVLALGRHTPLYWLLYRFVPHYGSFRGTAKFLAPAAALASMLAAIGFDRLLVTRSQRTIAIAVAVLAISIALLAIALEYTPIWRNLLAYIATAQTLQEDNEHFVDVPIWAYEHAGFIALTARTAMIRLLGAASVTAIFAGIVFASIRHRAFALLLLPLAVVELLTFSSSARATAPAALELPQAWRDEIARSPHDSRFVFPTGEPLLNAPMYFGFHGIWGYDPGVLKRYAELITFSQGGDPSAASQYVNLHQPSVNIFRMLRVKAVLQRNPGAPVIEMPTPLPTATLIRNYTILSRREEILRTLESASFDPHAAVILESAPPHVPEKGSSIGEVTVLPSSTDELEVRVDIETPAILLITNNFAEGWRARSVSNGPQSEYAIQPANWSQQAIALKAGRHHILLEYSPRSFRIGRWISILSILAIASGAIIHRRRKTATE